MKKNFILLLVLSAMALSCKPPVNPGTTPQSYIRLLNTDAPNPLASVRATSDGGVLFLYTAKVSGDSVTSIELTRTDANGDVLWTKHFGGAGNYTAGDCIGLPDGTIAVAGTHTLSTEYLVLFLLLDASGAIKQDREYAPPYTQLSVATIRQVDDRSSTDAGNFVIGGIGKYIENTDALKGLVFLRVSSSGDSLGLGNAYVFNYAINNLKYDFEIDAMSAISGGTGLAVGTFYNGTDYFRAIYQWETPPDTIQLAEYFFAQQGGLQSIVQTGPSSYVVAGDSIKFGGTLSTPGAAWIAGVSSPFNFSNTSGSAPNWSRALNIGVNGCITNIIQTADGGLAATGWSATGSGDTSVCVFRFDAKGNDVWPFKTFALNGGDIPNAIIEQPNGDLIIGGYTTSFGSRSSGARQLFLIHLKSDGTPAS